MKGDYFHFIIQVEEALTYLLRKLLNSRHRIRINLSFKLGVHQLPITDRISKFKLRSAREKIKTKG